MPGFLLAHLSDPHLGATWAGGDPARRLEGVVEAIRAARRQPDAVLVSGDLADTAADGEYEQVRDLLSRLDAPSYVLPGNHDDRRALHRHFGVPGGDGEPVLYSADLGPVRLVVLDTTRPGEDPGELDAARLGWLEAELAAAPATPTVLAMHHPPLVTGVPAWDDFGLAAADRHAFGEVVGRHPQVQRIVAGHVHRTMTAELAGRTVMTVPSTYAQARLDFRATALEMSSDPPGFAWHALLGGELVSHVQAVPGAA